MYYKQTTRLLCLPLKGGIAGEDVTTTADEEGVGAIDDAGGTEDKGQ